MKPDILWTIAVPTLARRAVKHAAPLLEELDKQATGYPVEVLYLGDNRRMSTGEKCNKLMDMAAGVYISFIGDDDWITRNYASTIVTALQKNPKTCLVSFDIQFWHMDDPKEHRRTFTQSFGLDQHFTEPGQEYRMPTPLHVWRKEVASQVRFPSLTWGEDLTWARALLPLLDSSASTYISQVLYHVRNHGDVSETTRDRRYGTPDKFTWRDIWSDSKYAQVVDGTHTG